MAFDIDGTLTRSHNPALDDAMVTVVTDLLRRGVPILLITGRGRGSTRAAAEYIRGKTGLSSWYMRRLQCITHNGVFLLSTPEDSPSAFLQEETTLGAQLSDDDLDTTRERIHELLRDNGFRTRDVQVTKEPHSLRLIFQSDSGRDRCERIVRPFLTSQGVFLTRGSYGTRICLDVASTNKRIALGEIAAKVGVGADKILRIGDQGQRGGNDYDLLDSRSGFSVSLLSDAPDRCFPVLDEQLLRPLRGAVATRQLLQNTLLFAPLSIDTAPLQARVRALRRFEALALKRSRREAQTVTNRIRVRLRYLLPDDDAEQITHSFDVEDIYDPLSGGVRLRDWELEGLPSGHPATSLFDFNLLSPGAKRPPRSRWSMYTDSGILLRGPNYYFGFSRRQKDRKLENYLPLAIEFLDQAATLMGILRSEPADLTRYKIVLAVADNVRNILLHATVAAFMAESNKKAQDYNLTQRLFLGGLAPHTAAHVAALLDVDGNWERWLAAYRALIVKIRVALIAIRARLIRNVQKVPQHKIFKWRECDHFLQNVTAVQLGLHEHRQRFAIGSRRPLVAIGLAYGATELPAIAMAVGKSRGVRISPGLAHVSLYNVAEVGDVVRAGGHDYVSRYLLKGRSLCVLDGTPIEDAPCLILDDNCTTATTLQLARDSLVTVGADVLGAILVRFPGVNRIAQMAMPGHGCPDPDVLFSLIRGLVAPSPYTRLIYPRHGKERYLDQTDMFDKARQRIERYLKKNRIAVR